MQVDNLKDIVEASLKNEVKRIGDELAKEYELEFRKRLNVALAQTLGGVKFHATQNMNTMSTELHVTVEMPEDK